VSEKQIKPRFYVELGTFQPKGSDDVFPICIPCWTREEIEAAEAEAERFMAVFNQPATESEEG